MGVARWQASHGVSTVPGVSDLDLPISPGSASRSISPASSQSSMGMAPYWKWGEGSAAVVVAR